MVDGRTFADPDRINPGWVLTLPGDAQGTPGAEVVAATGTEATPMTAEVDAAAAEAAPADTTRIEVLLPTSDGDHDEVRVEVLTPTDASRSEEHTSELQSLMRISYAVFCLKKKTSKRT